MCKQGGMEQKVLEVDAVGGGEMYGRRMLYLLPSLAAIGRWAAILHLQPS